MYRINQSVYASAFFLPTQVVDEHLRLAGKASLKVLLWLFRNPAAEQDISLMSRQTGIPADEIDDAMLYWVNCGIVESTDAEPVQRESKSSDVKPEAKPFKQVKAAVTDEDDAEPKIGITPSHIAARAVESEDVAYLFNEAQYILGRTLGNDALAVLLEMHDFYGLPTAVILTLCEYAKNTGRQNSLRYIAKIGKTWSDEDIDTFEKANERIQKMLQSDGLWNELRVRTGIDTPKPTQSQSKYLYDWTQNMSFGIDMIMLAYEKTAEKKGKIDFRYMNGILRSWHSEGIKTEAQAREAESRFADKMTSAKPSDGAQKNERPASYDIQRALDNARRIDPTKTKRS